MPYFKHSSYLPDHWKEWLRSFRPEREGKLWAEDFPQAGEVRLEFPDRSVALFKYAFCAEDKDRGELAVFTEHCRYHVFGSVDLKWSGPLARLDDRHLPASGYPLVTRNP